MIRKHDKRVKCSLCKKNPVKRIGRYVDGTPKYSILCNSCHSKKYTNSYSHRHSNYRYRGCLSDVCEVCGFVPIKKRQLDIHHIDGDHKNNNPDNLMTLCANCHRLYH